MGLIRDVSPDQSMRPTATLARAYQLIGGLTIVGAIPLYYEAETAEINTTHPIYHKALTAARRGTAAAIQEAINLGVHPSASIWRFEAARHAIDHSVDSVDPPNAETLWSVALHARALAKLARSLGVVQ